ncbi:MAG: FAD-binding oxidoreductase [Albidovulum sp.]|nr:FAD-binding oxidoreductase [Albidovulum sp.]MDE0532863.1 FAD-binding oxidoreductase [Albidovulum sp.]
MAGSSLAHLTPVSNSLREKLRCALPARSFPELSGKYLSEPRGRFTAGNVLVVAPKTANEVSKVLRLCGEVGTAVVPFGGGTGLVGGQIAAELPDPVLLSTERMKEIRLVSTSDNALVAEAGCTLLAVQDAARSAERIFPLSTAAQGSCQIGGSLATNAGGVHVIRYGNARSLCLGLEAVLPDGSIWNGLRPLRKNNAGYDLRDLLVGSEGTLGVITAACLKLHPRPRDETTCLLAVPDPTAALDLLELFQNRFGNLISAFELIQKNGYHFVRETVPGVKTPFNTPPDWSVLVDIGAEFELGLAQRLEVAAGEALDRGYASDGVIAASETQRQSLWQFRELIPEANRRIGSVSSHDISVPPSAIPDLIAKADQLLARFGEFRINCFGHVGDGNIHYNVFPPRGAAAAEFENLRAPIRRAIHGLAEELGGSFSAEHGIGRLKLRDLQEFGDSALLDSMRRVKKALDPLWIMNPGAVLPRETG